MNDKTKIAKVAKSDNYLGNIYFNGFGVGVSATDISVTMTLGKEDIGRLVMPFGTAKSLLAELARNIEGVENALGEICTIEETYKKMEKLWEK